MGLHLHTHTRAHTHTQTSPHTELFIFLYFLFCPLKKFALKNSYVHTFFFNEIVFSVFWGCWSHGAMLINGYPTAMFTGEVRFTFSFLHVINYPMVRLGLVFTDELVFVWCSR